MPNNSSPSAAGRGQQNVPPASTPAGAQRDYNAKGDYGTVLDVDALRYTARVQTNTGGVLPDVPYSGDALNHPLPGQTVGLGYSMGSPYIVDEYPNPAHYRQDRPEADPYSQQVNTWLSLTGTNLVFQNGRLGQRNYRGSRPHDMLSGDRGFVTVDGTMVYAGRGGIAGIKVNDLLQIVLNAVDDHMRLVSRNFELMTDFGVLSVSNTEGKTSLKLRAAATAEQTWQGDYELLLSVGAGKAYVDVTLLKDKTKVFTYKLGANGALHTFYADDVINQVKGNHGEAVGQHRKVSVGKTDTETIQDEKTIDVPKLHLGDKSGDNQPAVMGTELTDYLKSIVDYLNTQATFTVPGFGTTLAGTVTKAPRVPDFLSKVVDLTKTHTRGEQVEEIDADS